MLSDAALAIGLGVFGVLSVLPTRSPAALLWRIPFVVGLTAPLAWRRRAPRTVFAVVAALAYVQWWATGGFLVDELAVLLALYTVAAQGPRRWAVAAFSVAELGALLAVLRWSGIGSVFAFAVLSGPGVAAFVAGINTATRRAYLAALEERASRLQLEAEQRERLAAAAERARIAREMHDVIAHHLAVVIALADGGAAVVDTDPSQAGEVLAAVSRTGRTALAQMRAMLGVLRADDAPAPLAPAPCVSDLESLIADMCATGLSVQLSRHGTLPDPVAPGLEATVVRIVQEALTNTLKHAGPAAQARVRVRITDHHVDIDVTDDGGTQPASRPRDITVSGSGHGLVGMQERVGSYGGLIHARPLPGRGWRVHATLPVAAPAHVVERNPLTVPS
jgi:signal transduction histidine kinase